MINHRHSISIVLFFIGLYASAFKYTVSGDVYTTELDGQKAYLMLNDTNQLIDSAEITDGRFTMSGNAPSEGWARIDAGREFALMILSPSVIEIDFTNHAPLSGDSVNMAYRRHWMNQNALENVGRELRRYYLVEEGESKVREKMEPILSSYRDYMKMTIQANPDNAIAESALRAYAMASSPEQWKELYSELPPKLLGLQFTRKWDKKMSTALRMRPGCMFADVEGKSVDGAVSRLSDYVGRGRYVLVDFWASWCMPCRAEGRETLVPLYEKYGGDERFEILGVATWDDPARTLKAIASEGYKWPQIIDAGMTPMDAYGFDGIPMIMLFAPDGTMVAREIRGEGIWKAVENALK